MKNSKNQKSFWQTGFTLIELLVVMGVFSILSLIVVTTSIKPQTSASISSAVNSLVADLRQQQLKAMIGQSDAASPEPWGIYFQPTSYTLFSGSSYSSGAAGNNIIQLEGGVSLSTTFPSSQVVFSRQSGEVAGFVSGSNQVTLSHSSGGQKVITINALGVASVQ